MRCPDCDTPNPAGAKFCGACGCALALTCPGCGAATEPGQRFCRECGAPLPGHEATAGPASQDRPTGGSPAPALLATERRVVSVMFADLVGSTPIAERRDAEEVRDLLTRYFDCCRTVVGRYGGTIEKFIGDAVMAVWGAPRAHQDDAERAVRAALDIVAEVAALGEEAGIDHLAARAGVATGEVVATVGAVDQGIVTGDTVNTAARVQSAALPGGVRVDERTRLGSAAAIAYTDGGVHELKGKAEPQHLYDAVRVTATVGGAQRVEGLEGPFVGRARELRLVKELYHATEETARSRLVSVTGPAGVGKSRLGWEFFKYLDGLAGTVFWHAGRCSSYGEGVALWPLAEMVRMRFRMKEGDSRAEAADKLRAGLAEYVTSTEDREWLAPRLTGLLALDGEGTSHPREELFGAWRLLFESLARQAPVVMLVEELQWADFGLLEFLEDLLDLSRDLPIFVLTLARPELEDRRPGWGTGRRNATSLALDPLPDSAVRELVDNLVTGLPSTVRDAIVAQAEGIPLYAVETVRLLIDRDLVVRRAGRYVVANADQLTRSELSALGLPPSLTALVRARLDDLPDVERAVVADAAVLGTSFPRDTLARLVDLGQPELEQVVRALLRKEILTVTVDPRSPENGQYRFVQPLVRSVAYETLSRRDRKARHLAVARRLEADVADVAEISDVLADHYEAAYEAAVSDADAPEIRVRAYAAYRAAGDRALSLAAPENALGSYQKAAELAVEEEARAESLALAGRAALFAGSDDGPGLLRQAIDLHRTAGRTEAETAATIDLARSLNRAGQQGQAAVLLREALALHDHGGPDATAAQLAAGLAISLRFAGQHGDAGPPLDVALNYAQALELPEVLALALSARGNLMVDRGRFSEAEFDYQAAVTIAERNDLTLHLAGGTSSLANLSLMMDLPEAREVAERAVALCRRVGVRPMEMIAVGNLALVEIMAGRWDRAEQLACEALELETAPVRDLMHERLVVINVLRGHPDAAAEHAAACQPMLESDDVEARVMARAAQATVALARGELESALSIAITTLEESNSLGLANEGTRQAWPDALESALALGDLSRADELLGLVTDEPPGRVPRYLRSQHLRFRGLVARARGGDTQAVETDLAEALESFRQLGYPFWVGRTLLDLAGVLQQGGRGQEAASMLDEAETTFTALGARPWVDQARTARMSLVD